MPTTSATGPAVSTPGFRLALLLMALCSIPSPVRAQSQPAAKPWWERLTFSGDFRGRYEGFFQDDEETRHRERFRLRVGLSTRISEELGFGLRLASGERTDITSSNQSFTDFLNRKTINLDQAYIVYTPSAWEPLTLGGGKFAYPVTRTQLVWDDDVNWEGTYQQLAWDLEGPASIKLVAAQTPLNEVGRGKDAFMLGEYAQVAFTWLRRTFQLSAAVYNFLREDQIAVAVDELGLRNPNTNRVTRDAAGRVTGFLSEFTLVDVIAQGTLATAREEYPITLLADWCTNAAAGDDENDAIWLVAGYGRAARPGTVSVSYTYAGIDRDAVLSTFNYSDIPPTNVRVNMIVFSYMPQSRVHLDFTAILTKPLDQPVGREEALLKRVQADVRVSF